MARTSVLLMLIFALAMMSANAFVQPHKKAGGRKASLLELPILDEVVATTTTALNVKIKIDVGDGEPIESALRRFKRAVNMSGHMMELRHRRYFENTQDRKKRKIKEGRMRKKFERMQRRRKNQNA